VPGKTGSSVWISARHSPGLPWDSYAEIRKLLPVFLLLTGCGRYNDFTLPTPAGTPTAAHFVWQARPAPVLGHGAPGDWDSHDALNPSVVMFRGAYWNLYSGFDGKAWSTGLATSSDGIAWQKQGRVLTPDPSTWEGDYIAANGSAIVDGDRLLYFYQGGRAPRIGLAISTDGRAWKRHRDPVLDPGPRGSWDERGVADPCVIRTGAKLYMFYLGEDRARRQRLGVAVSNDGLVWTKLRSNPILELGAFGEFDENGLGEPAVWDGDGHYWMLYTGRNHNEVRRLGLSRSKDGVHWVKLKDIFAGDQPWNSKVICDPAVLPGPDGLRVWFGGGDVAHPAENIDGQIGFAVLSSEARPTNH
jgi:predicted GH43/DUF377 family glycosyl hydrolase